MSQWNIGGISLRRVVESEEPLLSPFEIFMDYQPADLAADLPWLAPRFYDPARELLIITIQSFLIRHNGLTILVDTCAGNDKERKRAFFDQRQWPWLDRLAAAGVTPEDIDVVLCSHMHVDHVGWNTRLDNGRWVPTFPNARYLFAEREWRHWQTEVDANGRSRTGDYVADSVLPIFAAGQAELIRDDHAIDPSIWIAPTPGHTPGHFSVHLAAAGQEAILSGDLMHSPLQLRHPDWSTRFCADPVLARDSRRRFLAAHADSGRLIFPAHFPSPTGGFVERDGDHYRFRYAEEPGAR